MKNSKQIIRTRFAPSPTGYLHIGGARTALFCWLFAKQHQGVFILRIEDTDVKRSTQNSTDAILDSLQWLNIGWKEGPYFQSQRIERYREVAWHLVDTGQAYLCYCSEERLIQLRSMQLKNKKKPRYDNFCRNKSYNTTSNPFVIRFRNPIEGSVVFSDMIRGTITVSNSELDDLIIVRANGVPTYNFTVVVDDWDMRISHVIRGDDHINNTPRQINVFKALTADIPKYAHVPIILGLDKKRLSKRHGALSVLQYRDDGYLSDALVNYLVRLGWSHNDQEIFSREEMINLFDINAVKRSPSVFNPEKLLWLNQCYLKTQNPMLMVDMFATELKKFGINCRKGPLLEQVIGLQSGRTKTLKEMAECSQYFFKETVTIEYESQTIKKYLYLEMIQPLQSVRDRLAILHTWEKELIYQIIIDVAKVYQLRINQLFQPIRIAITGNVVSPPVDAILHLIGRDLVLYRLDCVINFLRSAVYKAQ
ncbi:glutamate--tRNA ligase [Coxiella endosymbiont of Amblyomma americanum]|uniref:glutamate--tRNA ligase n=1 Tax=Coxiella endosymbiont of Amblyomma americanum TaxID=325775 RepID=UPI00057FD306|nr:glutamate--tRNA ligase [Coxiella endosymbiont of Amblyomma americanum]AJC50406.1 glutamyl-tRNA synthetase [Coxiella endosymbiont of Amblyomma americanum]AUJ58747.1 glutamate--tRNA ligase [Coxiella-like endosymbiont of Amblyomma americanum]